MAEIKFTKNELRNQQNKLGQLQKYLPTLQLKKAMLQAEVNEARMEISRFKEIFLKMKNRVEDFSLLLSERIAIDPAKAVVVKNIKKRFENIAGVEVPHFEEIIFENFSYQLFDTPPWIDSAIQSLRDLAKAKIQIDIAEEKKEALEKELREVSIRVNLFEKILIPRALANIKKIRVFLGDMQLAAVSQAKVAKTKIEMHKASLALTGRS